MDKKVIEKEAIIAEYLTGENSYRKLGNKYGVGFFRHCRMLNKKIRYKV